MRSARAPRLRRVEWLIDESVVVLPLLIVPDDPVEPEPYALEPVPDDVVPLPIELEPDGVVPVPGATLPELLVVGDVGELVVSAPVVPEVPEVVEPLERVLPEFIDPVDPVVPELIEPVEPVLPELIEPVEPVLPELIEPVEPVPVVLLVEFADPLLPVLLMPGPVLPGGAAPPDGEVALDPVEPVALVPPEVPPLVCATARPPPMARDTAAARVNNECLCVLLMMCSCRKLDMTVRSGCPLQRPPGVNVRHESQHRRSRQWTCLSSASLPRCRPAPAALRTSA